MYDFYRDTSTAIMVIALLFGMLRAAELEYERVFLLTTLAEAARQLPEIMAIWYVLNVSGPSVTLNTLMLTGKHTRTTSW